MCVCVTADMEQVSDDELDHAAEEDSDKEDQDLDKMFGAWLGELDKLTQVMLSHYCDVLYPEYDGLASLWYLLSENLSNSFD